MKKRKTTVARKNAASAEGLVSFWKNVGVMRKVLALWTVMLMVFSVPPGTPAIFEGWGLWRTVLFPVLAPILLQVLWLDALMASVFMADASGAARIRYRRILTMELVLSAVLVAWWLPYFLKLFGG